MTDILTYLSGLTQGYYGAFWERVDEVRMDDHNIMYTSTTGTNKDKDQHIDMMFQYGVGGRVYTSDTKGPRKTLEQDRYCDDVPLEFMNRNGKRGSLVGDQDFINQYVVDDNNKFWLYQFNREQLEAWARKKVSTTNGHYYTLRSVGNGKLMWAPLVDVVAPRTEVSYSKYDVDDYVTQVYHEVLQNGIESIKRLNPRGY